MCGIIGYVGEKQAAPIILNSLKNLEYRGYDSCGIAVIDNKKLVVEKDIGNIDEVKDKTNINKLVGNIGLGHTRWSTHGKVTRENAHPHTDCTGEISIVHNGIIENYTQLKESLIKKGHKFSSDTDSEIIAHLIEDNLSGNIVDAVRAALKEIEGSYALGVIHSQDSGRIIAAKKSSPLIIGIGKNENFIASDFPAIFEYTKKVIYLDDGEIAILTKNAVDIIDLDGRAINKSPKEVAFTKEMAQKQGHKHFMLKEIFDQPRAIEDTIRNRLKNGTISLDELNDEEVKKIKRIIMIACGTSWHAGLIGEFMLEELAKIPVEVEYSSEFRYRDPIIEPGTLVIAISQSGETADTIAAIREAKKKKAKVLSIVNTEGSTIERESDIVIHTFAGPEIGVASTKAFTSQLIVLYLLTVHIGKIRGVLPRQQVANRVRDLRKLPLQIQQVLESNDYIKLHSNKYYKKTNAIYLGRGINYPIALEGALKLKEVSYIHAEGYPAAEMKHGPIALIDKDMPVIVIATKDTRTYNKVLSNIEEVKSRGGDVIAIATQGDREISKKVDHTIYIPENSYILTPLLAVIPLQLFAYHVANFRDLDVDKPRHLAKSVTVE